MSICFTAALHITTFNSEQIGFELEEENKHSLLFGHP